MNRKEQREKLKNTTFKGLQKQFPSADKKGITWIMKNAKKIVKMYNNFCPDCKRLAMDNPQRPFTDYCQKCQEVAREVIQR